MKIIFDLDNLDFEDLAFIVNRKRKMIRGYFESKELIGIPLPNWKIRGPQDLWIENPDYKTAMEKREVAVKRAEEKIERLIELFK